MLTTIESESSAWTVIATDGELRIYSRESEGEWSEVSLGDSEQVDRDKALMLETLYGQQAGQDGGAEEPEEPEAEEEQPDLEEDEEEPEEEEEEEPDEEEEPEDVEEEEEEPEEEEEKPRRRRATASAGRGRSSSRRK
jgi:outer membrane biosynthesis protein TonB